MTMVRDGDVHRVPIVINVCRADRPGHRGPDINDDDIDEGDCHRPPPPPPPPPGFKDDASKGGSGRRPSLQPRPHLHRLPIPRPSVRPLILSRLCHTSLWAEELQFGDRRGR
jgi:hypothetical protein